MLRIQHFYICPKPDASIRSRALPILQNVPPEAFLRNGLRYEMTPMQKQYVIRSCIIWLDQHPSVPYNW